MTISIKKIDKINLTSFYMMLLLITPIIDNINGAFVSIYGETGLSIGTAYRLIIILISLTCISFPKRDFLWIFMMIYFPLTSAFRAIIEDLPFMSAFSYGLKWMFPVILISSFYVLDKKQLISSKIILAWRYIIPIILILEYIFKIGEKAYPEAGWRGLFYCNNDIAFSITMMMIISLYDLIIIGLSKQAIITSVLNLGAAIVLSTKSCLIFGVLTICVLSIYKVRKKPKSILIICFTIVFAGGIGALIFRNNIEGIIIRYGTYFQNAMINPSFATFMNFLTSSRTPRIEAHLETSFSSGIFGLLFGSTIPINNYAIEMDWFDLLFQHGIIGLVLGFNYYLYSLRLKGKSKFWRYIIFIAVICSFFSGHVINGALPSTVFAVVVSYARYYCNVNSSVMKED